MTKTIASPANLTSRLGLSLDYSTDDSGQLAVKVKDANNQELISLTNPKGMVDLSTLPYTGNLSLEFEVLQGAVEVRGYRITYLSDEKLSLTFKGKIKSDIILPDEIVNKAFISTTTPEITADNNTTTHILRTEATDLVIHKTVDKSSAGIDDTLTYTITYENKGPKDATNVVIIDQMPNQFLPMWKLEYTTQADTEKSSLDFYYSYYNSSGEFQGTFYPVSKRAVDGDLT
jgi:uncharacterized repeat protein (TIGR01451 family)